MRRAYRLRKAHRSLAMNGATHSQTCRTAHGSRTILRIIGSTCPAAHAFRSLPPSHNSARLASIGFSERLLLSSLLRSFEKRLKPPFLSAHFLTAKIHSSSRAHNRVMDLRQDKGVGGAGAQCRPHAPSPSKTSAIIVVADHAIRRPGGDDTAGLHHRHASASMVARLRSWMTRRNAGPLSGDIACDLDHA